MLELIIFQLNNDITVQNTIIENQIRKVSAVVTNLSDDVGLFCVKLSDTIEGFSNLFDIIGIFPSRKGFNCG